MLKNTTETYGSVSKFFHWSISVAVFVMLAIGFMMDEIHNQPVASQYYIFHKSLGLSILLVVSFRLIWYWINPAPNLDHLPTWQRIASRTVHGLLYLLLFLLPISGWVMSTAAGKAPLFFWTVQVPMPGIPQSKELTEAAVLLHNIFAWTLIVLVSLHILAAIKHHFINKDHVLTRMLP